MQREARLFVVGGVLAATLCAQQPAGKPAPVHAPADRDTKTGPAEPWVAPPRAPAPVARRVPSGKPVVSDQAARLDLFAAGSGVLIDVVDRGFIWAAANSYKLSVEAGRATFVPFLGSDAKADQPVAFELAALHVGSRALPLKASPEPVLSGDAVEFDHGPVQVRYELRRKAAEQVFRFDTLPARDTIRIELRVDTGLIADESTGSLRFVGPDGWVAYGDAIAIDAAGTRLPVERELHAGRLTLTVPATFVASAKLPLVVDPLLTSSTSVRGATAMAMSESDVVFDEVSQRYMVCVERVYSATDSDVYTYEMDANGQPIAGSVTVIDSSLSSWQSPRIANNRHAQRNLVVAQVSTNNVSPFVIAGRTRDPGTLSMGAQFTIEDQTSVIGDKIRPDVGGDAHRVGPTYFTVVWERVYSSSDHDIHGVQVISAVTPTRVSAGTIYFDNSGFYEQAPQIGNAAGAPIPNAVNQQWMVVWKRSTASGSDIFARTIRWDGPLGSSFVVNSGNVLQDVPSVSTVAMPDALGRHLYLVAWEQGYIGGTNDIMVRLCDQSGSVVSSVYNLQQLENAGAAEFWNQYRPRVASDGCRFVVAYGENYNNSGDLDVRVTTLHALTAGGGNYTIGVSEARVPPAFLSTVETRHALCADFESHGAFSGGPVERSIRYALSWHDAGSGAGNEIRFRLYAGMMPTGGFSVLPTGCGSSTITYGGNPALAQVFDIQTNGQALLAGTLRAVPLPLCSSCALGIDAFASLPPTQALIVPCSAALLGGTLGFQGVMLLRGEPCLGGTLSVTDTVLVTIR